VLVLDGPITNELQAVVDEFSGQYHEMKVIPHPTNQGLGKALNLGLQHCSYEIIARMDTDDISVDNRFEMQIEYMKDHPDVSIISSAIDEFADDWRKPIQVKTLPLSHEELYKMAKFRNPINHMAAMMRRDEILRIGSYRHIPYVEDYELWVRALINGLKIANLADVLVHARVGNGMVKRRGTKKYIKSWHIMNKEMLSAKMINGVIYMRNMLSIIGFVYMPNWVKELLYKYVLRKEEV
jgi:glycosyltransferase involved in cell wall biosynthesis